MGAWHESGILEREKCQGVYEHTEGNGTRSGRGVWARRGGYGVGCWVDISIGFLTNSKRTPKQATSSAHAPQSKGKKEREPRPDFFSAEKRNSTYSPGQLAGARIGSCGPATRNVARVYLSRESETSCAQPTATNLDYKKIVSHRY